MNTAAYKMESDLRKIAGLPPAAGAELDPGAGGPVTVPPSMAPGGRPGATFHPTTPDEIQAMKTQCYAVFADQGKDNGPTDDQVMFCQTFFKQYNITVPGLNEPGGGGSTTNPAQPTPGSFATKSIDSFSDFLDFCKASAVMVIGASMYPALIVPTNIIVAASLIYGLRNQIKHKWKLNLYRLQ